MEIYEVTPQQQFMIKKLFSGFVFRRNDNGKTLIKVSKKQIRDISLYLGITLINPITL